LIFLPDGVPHHYPNAVSRFLIGNLPGRWTNWSCRTQIAHLLVLIDFWRCDKIRFMSLLCKLWSSLTYIHCVKQGMGSNIIHTFSSYYFPKYKAAICVSVG
jgi:hypothetical protein